MLGRTRRIHFVGVGGSGMSGIAELLANLGYDVSGSDMKATDVTRRLESLGVRVFEGHDAAHVGDADVVVVSSAVRPTNPELIAATQHQIPVIPRAEMLAELMRLRHGIAIAGAHGKTTTTSMTALVLERAGLDPTAVIGGRLSAFGSNARLGRGQYMVAEADESDGSFLKLSPTFAVITNVDDEHLDHYGTFDRVQAAFVEFANRVPFYGAVIACADDPRLRALVPRITRRVITYGLDSPEADLIGEAPALEAFGSRCTVTWQPRGRHEAARERLGELRLRVPGRHNMLNALASVAVGLELKVPFDRIVAALAEFKGAERRFDVLGEAGGVMVVDDYGHHPTEIAAVLAAARAGMTRRVLVAFQPHRYTRTRHLLREFGRALTGADEIVLTDIYSAGEDPLPGITIEALAREVTAGCAAPVHVVPALADVPAAVVGLSRSGDIIITLGAGSIGGIGPRILEMLRQRGTNGVTTGGTTGATTGGTTGSTTSGHAGGPRDPNGKESTH